MKNWTKKGPNGLDIKAFPCKMVILLFIKFFCPTFVIPTFVYSKIITVIYRHTDTKRYTNKHYNNLGILILHQK